MNENEPGAAGVSAGSIIADALRRDAEVHAAGRFDEIGRAYDDVLAATYSASQPATSPVVIALEFWGGWIDSRNHDWQFYPGIVRDDWPVRAAEIAAALESGDEISDPTLLRLFTPQPRRSIREWFRDLFGRPPTGQGVATPRELPIGVCKLRGRSGSIRR